MMTVYHQNYTSYNSFWQHSNITYYLASITFASIDKIFIMQYINKFSLTYNTIPTYYKILSTADSRGGQSPSL